MPRKTGTSAGSIGPRQGFNEAGAVMPRKDRVHVLAGGRILRASMRPGLLCPGSPRATVSSPRPTGSLQ